MKHVDNIIRCLVYLQCTNDVSLVLGGDQGVQMMCNVDKSYAPDGKDFKSITGATFYMANNTGSMITMSTICEDLSVSSEGIGCHLLVRRVLPLRYFIKELFFSQHEPKGINMDNLPFLNSVLGEKRASIKSKL